MAATMSGTVAVSTGQPVVVPGADSGGWMPAAQLGRQTREVRFVLYNVDGSNIASMILEVAEAVVNGVATHSEVIEKNVDISAAPGEQKTYVLQGCSYPFVRLSASGPSPSYASTNVQGGIEILQ